MLFFIEYFLNFILFIIIIFFYFDIFIIIFIYLPASVLILMLIHDIHFYFFMERIILGSVAHFYAVFFVQVGFFVIDEEH
jgi:hypothetical protein